MLSVFALHEYSSLLLGIMWWSLKNISVRFLETLPCAKGAHRRLFTQYNWCLDKDLAETGACFMTVIELWRMGHVNWLISWYFLQTNNNLHVVYSYITFILLLDIFLGVFTCNYCSKFLNNHLLLQYLMLVCFSVLAYWVRVVYFSREWVNLAVRITFL